MTQVALIMYKVVWSGALIPGVLVLARIELMFFLAAGTVLSFGFGMSIMLITH